MIFDFSKLFYDDKFSNNQEEIYNYEILDNLEQDLDNNKNLEDTIDEKLEDEINEKSDIIIKEIVEEIIDKIDKDEKNLNKGNKNFKTTNCIYFTYGIIVAIVLNKII